MLWTRERHLLDVHQALDWVNALSEAESDGGEVSGLSDVSHLKGHYFMAIVPCTCTNLI